MFLLPEAVAVVLAADFSAGFIHWLEDAYVREDTPLVGKYIGRPNIIHHHFPRHFTRHGWWRSSWDLFCVSALLLAVAWWFGFLTWQVWLFAALTTNSNEFHKWAHRTRRENGVVISFLQDVRLLQTARHHAFHHTDPKNSHYGVITNLLNPALDGIRFWAGLEWLLARMFGLRRREDTSVHGCGPGPGWLEELDAPTSRANRPLFPARNPPATRPGL